MINNGYSANYLEKKKEFITFVLSALVPITFAVGVLNLFEGYILSGIVNTGSSVFAVILYLYSKRKSTYYVVSNGTAVLASLIFSVSAYEKMDQISFMVWLPLYAVFYFMITNIKSGFIWTGITYTFFVSIYYLIYSSSITFLNFTISSLALFSTVPLVYYYEKNNLIQIKNLRELASIDPLTSLLNRRSFFEILNSEIAHSKRFGRSMYLMIMDLDFFKLVNDEFGHSEGDRVLQECSSFLQRNIREGDYLGRYGGEEFILICKDSDEPGSIKLAKKLNKEIRKIQYPRQMSISIGIAKLESDDNAETLTNKADQAMYSVKKAGRDSFMIYHERISRKKEMTV